MNMEKILMTPGPVPLHPEVRKILSLPMIHHRTPQFDQILKSTLEDLKLVFQTTQRCFVLSGTGSLGMEILLSNTISAGDQVLAIDSGKFGERWHDMALMFTEKVHRLKVPWGKAVDPTEVSIYLKNNPNIKAVICQACETSTGVVHPIEQMGEIIKKYPNTLFLVDGITALGAMDLPMDLWGIDGLVGGSQKAFMLPTGLCLISFSAKAWKVINQCKTPRFYTDIRRENIANEKGETYFSSNVVLIRALGFVLNEIKKTGLPYLLQQIQKRADFVRHFAQEIGFTLYASSPSNSVSALLVPNGMDSQKMRQYLEDKKGIVVMGGQDEAKGKILRIGHMGYIQDQELVELILSLGDTLVEMDSSWSPRFSREELKQNLNEYLKTK